MKTWFHIHTYDRGDMWESIIGPPFRTKTAAVRWAYLNTSKLTHVAKWEIKEHSL